MKRQLKIYDRQHLYTIYRRIKSNCCEDWESNPQSFYEWYEKQESSQNKSCIYCGLSGNTTERYKKIFREGRRGVHLEVDRKISKAKYSPENCVLACYPCNNAKSDVFTYEEFLKIGRTIGNVMKDSGGK